MISKKWLAFVITLSLLSLLIIPACGGDGEEPTSTPATTSVATATPAGTPTAIATPTASPASTKPVKIGGICSWSGPAAVSGNALANPIIELVEQQVKDMGGILGGREVKVVKYDNRGSVAEAAAGAQKLMVDDKVSALIWGGVSGAEGAAISAFAEEHQILHVDYGYIEDAENKKCSLSATLSYPDLVGSVIKLANNLLKPETVAFLGTDLADSRRRVPLYKEGMEPNGIKTVYEEYVQLGTSDLMGYLTKIKFENPDVLVIDSGNNELYMTIAQQMQELGGWGDIQVVGLAPVESAAKMAGAQGWYAVAMWVPGLQYPGAIKYQDDYQAMFGRLPTATQVYYYNGLWTAIYAIELAGTDTDLAKIAEMARFSGQLEWDTPMGRAHYTAESDGYPQLHPTICQVQDKQMVIVEIPE